MKSRLSGTVKEMVACLSPERAIEDDLWHSLIDESALFPLMDALFVHDETGDNIWCKCCGFHASTLVTKEFSQLLSGPAPVDFHAVFRALLKHFCDHHIQHAFPIANGLFSSEYVSRHEAVVFIFAYSFIVWLRNATRCRICLLALSLLSS